MFTTRSTLVLLLSLIQVNVAMHAMLVNTVDGPHETVEYVSSQQSREGSAAVVEQEHRAEKAVALIDRTRDRGDALVFKKCAAEFIATTLFVFFGCGSAMSAAKENGWTLQVSLTFGLGITVLAYALGHYSGAHINSAVSFGLMLHGKVGWGEGILDIIAQLLGATFGASLLKVIYPGDKDRTGGLGTNAVQEGWSQSSALLGEFICTFLLVYVIFETAVNSATAPEVGFAPLAIGLAVFLSHSVLIPIDGCSINPARSFGPAMVQVMTEKGSDPFKDMWVFWVGPLSGAAAAYGIYAAMH